MKRINLNVLIGIFLLVVGVLLSLEKLNITINIDYAIMAWSFISILGIFMMINDSKVSTFPLIFLFVGLWNVLNILGILSGSIFSLFWPIIIIIIGVNLVFSKSLFSKCPANLKNSSGGPVYNGIFSGVEERVQSKDFKGLTANAIFGGVELDLRDVEITEDVQIDISALFGGVVMILPEKYNIIKGESLALFGGIENKFKGQYDESKKTIYINSRAIFGGAELK